MKKAIVGSLLICLAILMYAWPVQAAENGTLEAIQKAIGKKGAEWTAGETSVSGLSLEEKQLLLGDIETVATSGSEIPPETPIDGYAPTFDWRTEGGEDWTTSIKDQGGCGSCFIFGSVAVVEAMKNIEEEDPDIDVDLSEQFVLSCCPTCGDCGGGYSTRVLEFIRTCGVPDEDCFPYQADDTIPCNQRCADWGSRAIKILNWYNITMPAAKETVIAHLLDGPVTASFKVYEDFYYYTGGIYEYVWGDYQGGHLIAIVGYNDTGEYWICKNSWGTGWGENGWFRIKYEECDIQNRHMEYASGVIQAPVGGIYVPVDKLALLAPYIALTSTIIVATATTAIYVEHVKRRKKKQ